VLPASFRMRSGTDFAAAVRRGRRAGSPRVVLHLVHTDAADGDRAAAPAATSSDRPTPDREASAPTGPRVGFVVSKSVGGSVVRHRVARRLREAVRPHLAVLPSDVLVVVRAQPAAATSSFDDLVADVTRLLTRLGALDGAAAAGARRTS
jgi:ribonuclease P protein component